MQPTQSTMRGMILVLSACPLFIEPAAGQSHAKATLDNQAGLTVAQEGLLLELRGVQLRNARIAMPKMATWTGGRGLTVEFWITPFDIAGEQVILDARDSTDRGLTVTAQPRGALALELNDGRDRTLWASEEGVLRAGKLHHIFFMVDGDAGKVVFKADGRFRAGRFQERELHEIPLEGLSGGMLRIPSSFDGRLKMLRIYSRSLHDREAVGNHLFDLDAEPRRELPPAERQIAPIRAPFPMPQLDRPRFPNRTFNIRDHGAVPGGQVVNTEAIAAAIDACADAGGGRVLAPPGIWLTGAVRLRSNVELHLDKGAVLLFSTNPSDYLPPVFTRWAGFECYNYSPLIYARDCINIAVTGEGRLDGQGEAWWPWVRRQAAMSEVLIEMGRGGVPVEHRVFGNRSRPLRPQFISPIGCKNVLIKGVSVNAGPFWTIHCVYCENVIIRGVAIDNYGPNNDGVNLDSCRNALVEYCEFNTGDDCVALKSGINEDGWRVGRATENVVIRHCLMKQGHVRVTVHIVYCHQAVVIKYRGSHFHGMRAILNPC